MKTELLLPPLWFPDLVTVCLNKMMPNEPEGFKLLVHFQAKGSFSYHTDGRSYPRASKPFVILQLWVLIHTLPLSSGVTLMWLRNALGFSKAHFRIHTREILDPAWGCVHSVRECTEKSPHGAWGLWTGL